MKRLRANKDKGIVRSTGRPGARAFGSKVNAGQFGLRSWLLAIGASLALTGCSTGSMSDLEAYMQDVLTRKGGKIEPIPPLEPYVVYTYQSSGSVNPFESFFKEEAPGDQPPLGQGPDLERNKEELEGFALDSLRMMGTLEQDEDVWGVIRSPDGRIHRVRAGNYLGLNHGKISFISEDKIELIEIVVSQGRWQERPAAVALPEE